MSTDDEVMRVAFNDVANGDNITERTMLTGYGTNPLNLPRSTFWMSLPGGYWEYKNPWTQKALDTIIGIQNELDGGKEVSSGMDWRRCMICDKWFNERYRNKCIECRDDDYDYEDE